MSYNLMFAGHKDFDNPADAIAFEEQVAEQARGIAATLEGLTSASGSFEHTGPQSFTPQPTDAPVEPEPAAGEPSAGADATAAAEAGSAPADEPSAGAGAGA